MPGDPGATVVTNACAYYTSRTRPRVQRAPGIPRSPLGVAPRPPFRGGSFRQNSGDSCRGNAKVYLGVIARSESDEAIQSSLLPYGLLRFARNDDVETAVVLEMRFAAQPIVTVRLAAMQKYPMQDRINRRIFSAACDVFDAPPPYLLPSDNQHGMGRWQNVNCGSGRSCGRSAFIPARGAIPAHGPMPISISRTSSG